MDLVKFIIFYFMAMACLKGVVAATNCSYPGSPAHSRVFFSNAQLEEGTVATYTCEEGFELLGPSRRICEAGRWTPEGVPFCVINVAAGKAPMQISTEEGGTPQKALDGSSALVFTMETCTLTKCEKSPWWYVNLLEPYMVQLVRLDFGKPCCGNTPATIVVRVGNNRPDLGTNPTCNRFTGYIEAGHPLFLPCNPPMPGAFVSVHLEATIPGQLSLCEAFVYTDQALPIERCPQFRDQPLGSAATYNGKCYIFYDRPATFQNAQLFCAKRGGTLVDESNPALQGFISWELWRRHRSDSSSQYWMGAVRDRQNPTNWKWINGNDVTVSFWNAPTRGENCARFDGSKGWLWADTNCQSELSYICQHQPKTCGRPEQPPNSTIVADLFDVGATVEYACDEGHLLVGPTVRTCLDTGFYDAFAPICKIIECGFPAEIAHGSYSLINGSVSYLSHVQYSCEPGYEMTGRSRLVCDIDERWNGPPPRCDVVQCEKPPVIANGQFSLLNNAPVFGALAEYQCSKGFILDGARRIKCLSTGLWDKPAPRCYLVQCEKPPLIQNGRVSLSNSVAEFGVVAEYECSKGYILDGARNIECLANGLWDKPAPRCYPEELITTTRLPTTSTWQPSNSSTTQAPRLILPTRPRTQRPVTSNSTVPSDPPTTRRSRPKITTTERTTTKRTTTKPPPKKTTVADSQGSSSSQVPHIIVASHSKDKNTGNGSSMKTETAPALNQPQPVQTSGARLNIGALVALAAFGALVFLIAIIITAVILFRRGPLPDKEVNHYRHCTPPVFHTLASLDSSSSGSQRGLNKCYRQAWEELTEATGAKHAHRRAEREAPKDGSELVVSDVYPARSVRGKDERRRHHHHHRREPRAADWRGRTTSEDHPRVHKIVPY